MLETQREFQWIQTKWIKKSLTQLQDTLQDLQLVSFIKRFIEEVLCSIISGSSEAVSGEFSDQYVEAVNK